MTKIKNIETKNPELNELLNKLNLVEMISYGAIGPIKTEYREIKRSDKNNGINEIRPISVEDLVKLYECVKEQ